MTILIDLAVAPMIRLSNVSFKANMLVEGNLAASPSLLNDSEQAPLLAQLPYLILTVFSL